MRGYAPDPCALLFSGVSRPLGSCQSELLLLLLLLPPLLLAPAAAHVVSVGLLAPLSSPPASAEGSACAAGWQALWLAQRAVYEANLPGGLAARLGVGSDGAPASFVLEALPADSPAQAIASAAAFSSGAPVYCSAAGAGAGAGGNATAPCRVIRVALVSAADAATTQAALWVAAPLGMPLLASLATADALVPATAAAALALSAGGGGQSGQFRPAGDRLVHPPRAKSGWAGLRCLRAAPQRPRRGHCQRAGGRRGRRQLD